VIATAAPLTRQALAEREPDRVGAPPVRIVHLGLGHFFRAHQAWYTSRAADAGAWGIAAFTGRSTRIAEDLAAQDGLFALVERGPEADRVEVVTSLVEAVPGVAVTRLADLLADPRVAIVTLTITESGYRLRPDGGLDLDDPLVRSDLEQLRSATPRPETVLGRLLFALDARRRADAGAIAIVSCDNIPDNGSFLAGGLTALAERVDASLAAWISTHVSFVSTSVDRITPHIDEAPAAVAEAGWVDRAPVVTEPFADWVLAGDFPAGRPDWESAGARFVDDIEPWENRKLWLLNGAHSILAFAGLRRGLHTVADAIAHPECRALVEAFWAEAVHNLPPGTEHVAYREQLLERFANPRIVHRLGQIAAEATTKAQFRFAAVAERSVRAGREPAGSTAALAVWIDWVLAGDLAPDARADDVRLATASDDPIAALLALVSPDSAASPGLVAQINAALPAVTTRIPLTHEGARQ
jgi:fructuronate reductase